MLGKLPQAGKNMGGTGSLWWARDTVGCCVPRLPSSASAHPAVKGASIAAGTCVPRRFDTRAPSPPDRTSAHFREKEHVIKKQREEESKVCWRQEKNSKKIPFTYPKITSLMSRLTSMFVLTLHCYTRIHSAWDVDVTHICGCPLTLMLTPSKNTPPASGS